MITEIAQIDVKPGMETEFEAGVAKAAPVFQRAKGCHGLALEKSIEKPSRYRLFVQWDTVENHTVDFPRQSRFPGMARLRRALLREPAGGRAHRAGVQGLTLGEQDHRALAQFGFDVPACR